MGNTCKKPESKPTANKGITQQHSKELAKDDNMKTKSMPTEKYLVEGFIRAVEQLFVPQSIIDLCFMFYSTNSTLFIQYYRNYRGYGVTSYSIINLATKRVFKLAANNKKMTLNRYVSKIPPVFISNIGKYLPNLSNIAMERLNIDIKNNSYDGFVGIAARNISIDTGHYTYYPMIMFYEPENDITNLKVLISNHKCPKLKVTSSGVKYPISLVYCGEKHG
eukprot:93875_1